MEVLDSFFAGRSGWAEQVLLSVQVLEKGNREFRHPKLAVSEAIADLVTWDAVNDFITIKADFPILSQLLVNRPTMARRVQAFTPINVLDVGLDRDLATGFYGLPVQDDLMAVAEIITLEERLNYLLQAKIIHDALVAEWNAFADLQEILWLKIYRDENQIESEYTTAGAWYQFTQTAGLAGSTGGTYAYQETPAPIRDIGRADYEAAITQWLLDSGTTARSGGVAVDNDSYIEWMAARLSEVSTDSALIPARPIDPRYVYRYAPIVSLSLGTGEDGGGSTGADDSGNSDPATSSKPGLDLREELSNREQPLTAQLDAGASTAPINTLPDC
jgi:hypothetical protein